MRLKWLLTTHLRSCSTCSTKNEAQRAKLPVSIEALHQLQQLVQRHEVCTLSTVLV